MGHIILVLTPSVLLRQNPHNVHEWLKRVKLFEGKPREVSHWLIGVSCLKSYVVTPTITVQTLTPSHPHTLTSSHPHTLTSSHPHILTRFEEVGEEQVIFKMISENGSKVRRPD